MFLMLSELWSVSAACKENPSVSVGIYFSLMSPYKGQWNKTWYSFSKLFLHEGQFWLTALVGWYLLLTPISHIPRRSFIKASPNCLIVMLTNFFFFFFFLVCRLEYLVRRKRSLVEILKYLSSLKRPIILFLNDERKANLSATLPYNQTSWKPYDSKHSLIPFAQSWSPADWLFWIVVSTSFFSIVYASLGNRFNGIFVIFNQYDGAADKKWISACFSTNHVVRAFSLTFNNLSHANK